MFKGPYAQNGNFAQKRIKYQLSTNVIRKKKLKVTLINYYQKREVILKPHTGPLLSEVFDMNLLEKYFGYK